MVIAVPAMGRNPIALDNVKNATLNRKMSEYESSPITRNERENEKSDVSTKFSTYADVVKNMLTQQRRIQKVKMEVCEQSVKRN